MPDHPTLAWSYEAEAESLCISPGRQENAKSRARARYKSNRDVARACLAEWNLRDLFWDAAKTADQDSEKRLKKAAGIRGNTPTTDKQAMHSAGVLERRAREFQIRAQLLRELAEQVSADVEPNPKRKAPKANV